jgi:hypothetical protein
LEEVRAPGASRADVDALLRGLAGPLAQGKPARERADLLLALLQNEELRGLSGSDARPVRTAALEALLALGYPYALEVPPELLAELRPEARRPDLLQRWNFQLGLALPVLAAVVECAFISAIDGSGSSYFRGVARWLITLSLVTSVLPTLLAFLGTWKRRRVLNGLGIWPMGLAGLGVMLVALGIDDRTTPLLFCLGAARLIGAVCLRLPKGEERNIQLKS